jgi:hypothetical protein
LYYESPGAAGSARPGAVGEVMPQPGPHEIDSTVNRMVQRIKNLTVLYDAGAITPKRFKKKVQQAAVDEVTDMMVAALLPELQEAIDQELADRARCGQ